VFGTHYQNSESVANHALMVKHSCVREMQTQQAFPVSIAFRTPFVLHIHSFADEGNSYQQNRFFLFFRPDGAAVRKAMDTIVCKQIVRALSIQPCLRINLGTKTKRQFKTHNKTCAIRDVSVCVSVPGCLTILNEDDSDASISPQVFGRHHSCTWFVSRTHDGSDSLRRW